MWRRWETGATSYIVKGLDWKDDNPIATASQAKLFVDGANDYFYVQIIGFTSFEILICGANIFMCK